MNEIIEYVRDANRNPNGCFVANKFDDDKVIIGWSAYNSTDEDRPFTKDDALAIARGRVQSGSGHSLPFRLRNWWPSFEARCCKYFKVSNDDIFVSGHTI